MKRWGKKKIIFFLLLFYIINIVNAAQITGYFIVEPEKVNSTDNTANTENVNVEEKTDNVPAITSSAVKEKEDTNIIFDYIKNFFVKVFSFFKK